MKRSIKFPWLTKEWSSKNGLEIDDASLKGSDKVHWVCNKGHEWTTSLKNRCVKNPSGCPICSGRICAKEESLGSKFPEIACEIDDASNEQVDIFTTHPGTPKKLRWRCKNNHRYLATVRQRTIGGKGCPTCESIEFQCPELMREWHWENNDLSPQSIKPGSNKRVWWRCDQGHEWQAIVSSRALQKTGCPQCKGKVASTNNNFAKTNPDKAQYWDYKKNTLNPSQVTPYSNKNSGFVAMKVIVSSQR